MIQQKENDSKEEYLARLFKMGDESTKRLDKLFTEIKEIGITCCGKCGCDIYPDKKHEC